MKKAVYIATGINLDGRKDVRDMWVGENESDKYWATILNGLRNRGVEDIFIAFTDNPTGFSAAIEAVFPKTEIQNCIVHQIRNSTRYVSYKDLKAVYAAVDEPPPWMPWSFLPSTGIRNTLKFPVPGGIIGPTSALISSTSRRFSG